MGARLGRSIAIGIALAALAVAWRYSHIHSVQAAPGQSAASDPVFTNALIHSTSPYLLEHAHNPVNWYPWGPEALNLAVQQKKPIFLSIGYLACHWCHVMMREDFENPEIAKILNDGFVCIKVDREQRPDLDDQYITAVQMMTGSGGWPLSVFLLPDRKPFFGGTYFPPEEFKPLLLKILDLYAKQPAALQSQADRVAAALAASAAPRAGGRLAGDILQQAVSDLKARYDPREGGFAVRPKFPEAPDLAFLLAQYRAAHDSQCLQMVTHTLDRMAAGGIYDQLGGGFHRYSTDEIWRVPHFEKMLYDQALLVPIYLDAYQITKKPRYRQVAEETLGFVEREMRDPGGGFYSSLDADSEGEEGKYYLWTPAQVAQVLGRDAPIFDELYGVTNEGDLDGKSVLHLAEAPAAVARAHHLSEAQLTLLAAALRQRMLSARARRVRPATDDKILASWNGLMMAAFARAYSVLGNPHYLADAVNDARFINTGMNRNGGLFHSWRRGAVEVPGMLEDYASVAYGLEAIYDATHQKTWLEDAVQVAGQLAPRFEDKQNGGFFSTGDQGDLLGRRKEADDTVMPSGNSLAALALARLSSWTGDAIWRQTAARTIEAFQPVVSRSPGAFPALLMAYREAGFNQPAFTGAQASIVTATVTPDHATVRAGAQVPVTITVSVRDGWHINAHRISLPYLIPTDIRIPGSAAEKSYWDYPSGDPLKLSYAAKPLLVYQGRISIRGRVAIQKNAPAGSSRLHLVLHYQPCTDRACQAPAEIALEMGITVVR